MCLAKDCPFNACFHVFCFFTAKCDTSTERRKYGRTYDEELVWDLDNHGTMVAGIIKEKGPLNIRFYNFKVRVMLVLV